MRAYYINLESSLARREAMEARFRPLLPELERVPASTPFDVPPDFRDRRRSSSFARVTPPSDDELWRTAACAHSHFRAWRLAAANAPYGALVLEDDVTPAPDFLDRVAAFEADHDRNLYDLVFLNRRMRFWLEAAEVSRRLPGALVSLDAILVALGGTVRRAGPKAAGFPLPGVGGDGYWVSARGAEKLTRLGEAFQAHCHVDWMLASAASARTPRAFLLDTMKDHLYRLDLRRAAIDVGGISAAVGRRAFVLADAAFDSVRRVGIDA